MSCRYTFWRLLSQNAIVIPMIQRDYAQGRPGEYERKIAKKLINDVKEALVNNKPINLDFIYGNAFNGEFIPLDGQQRLTTLFLVHWYMAARNNLLMDHLNTLIKFTYKTRITSTDFCTQLVRRGISFDKEIKTVSKEIEDSPWFFLSWRLDPTVVSMLNMLDIIHMAFKDVEVNDFMARLVIGDPDLITFDLLELREYKLTDELYVKMNARGKPLTEFENVKAKIAPRLNDHSRKMDNEWLDVFWRLEAGSENRTYHTDSSFYAYIRNMTVNLYLEQYDAEDDKTYIDNFDVLANIDVVLDDKEAYSQFTQSLDFFVQNTQNDLILQRFVHPTKDKDVEYSDKLKFQAFSKFIFKTGAITDANSIRFAQWTRVTNNLINNTSYDDPIAFMRAIRSINSLGKHSDDIYTALSQGIDVTGFSRDQIDEEKVKASLVLADKSWENLIRQAESPEYFEGQIGFILQYSKISASEFSSDLFTYFSRIITMLFSDQFKENHDFLFQRALLSCGDYLIEPNKTGYARSFCIFNSYLRAKRDNWRKVFNDPDRSDALKTLLLKIRNNVTDYNSVDEIKKCLQSIVDSSDATDWRIYFIKQPEYLSYCRFRQIAFGRDGGNKIYLLSKKTMACMHEELYSKDLFIRLYVSGYQPFNKCSYIPSGYKDVEPYIYLSECLLENVDTSIVIINEGSYYQVVVKTVDGSPIPDGLEITLSVEGFIEGVLRITDEDPLPKIKTVLDQMAQHVSINQS